MHFLNCILCVFILVQFGDAKPTNQTTTNQFSSKSENDKGELENNTVDLTF